MSVSLQKEQEEGESIGCVCMGGEGGYILLYSGRVDAFETFENIS